MRIRTYPAVAFAAVVLLAAYLGLGSSKLPSYKQSDKLLHGITFFFLTLFFYWSIETNRKRTLHLTVLVCTLVLGVGSEIAQALLPNGREYDTLDIVANVAGSLLAVGLSLWYHKRMLERKRRAKSLNLSAGLDDVELGEDLSGQESGVVGASTLEDEVNNWDENAEDWEDDEPQGASNGPGGGNLPSASAVDGIADSKKA